MSDKTPYDVATMADSIGREFTAPNTIIVDQDRINQFAEATGDHQWIHVDVEKAKAHSPFKTTVAHGFLTLSLLASDVAGAGVIPRDASAVLNYGTGKCRFLSPVPAGASVRARYKLSGVEPKGEGRQLVTIEATLDIDGGDKPAVIADLMAMVIA